VNGGILQKTGNIFENSAYAGVWQDKAPQVRYAAGRTEPHTADEVAVYHATQHGSEKRQTAHVSSRIPPHIKTGLLQIAKANGWTESKVVATACEAYLEHDLGEKFGLRLAAQVTDATRKELKKHSNREAYLSAQGYYAAEESRIINTKVLSYLFGEETEIYNQFVTDARREARDNIMRQIEEK
jgi:predicted DNA-binding protein